MREYYNKKENCFKDLVAARRLFGDKNTTKKQYEGMERALAFMYLYAPDEILTLVWGTIKEAGMRKVYFKWYLEMGRL